LYFLGAWVLIRLAQSGIRRCIWRLRNRLYVTYLFIAVVPICLILVLAGVGAYMFTSQVAVFLVKSELERRTASLRDTAQILIKTPAGERERAIRQMADYYERRFTSLQILVRDGREFRHPPDAPLRTPPAGWGDDHGIVYREGALFAWAHARTGQTEVVLLTPMPENYLSSLIPNLGDVAFIDFMESGTGKLRREAGSGDIPPPANRADIEVQWFFLVPAAIWDQPGEVRNIIVAIRTRLSAVLRAITTQRTDIEQNLGPAIFVGVSILFFAVELVSFIIGVSLTRTITGTVHDLYEGTQRVREGNFAHRIPEKGNDQLGELAVSFNRMTANLERLLAVAKEKERLQAELELAREVQAQLYPKTTPQLKTLRLTATCNPARLVSGDYFDYQALMNNKVALALGDVAGKGISAALLMATVESSLRTQLRNCLDNAARNGDLPISTSSIVTQLNRQIYADTAPEKYLTFYFGLYDDDRGILTYTNAGHLPPLIIREGSPLRLDINGTVVGAFPHATFDESEVCLEPGDLLVCYTDGITEPENAYGEMFGEERLIEVLSRNAERDEPRIVEAVMAAVLDWTGSPELQDDMTLLLARRK
jgi:sigma-B regulation protein RsbU (phosphoserine phosphatase)